MIAVVVTLAAALTLVCWVLGTVTRQVLAENRRLTAAVAAPSREAAQQALTLPDRPRRRADPAEHEPVKTETIGL